jgi:hypothetical protein
MENIMEFKVQKAGLGNGEWKTICTNINESYAREIYKKSLELYSIGRFRILAGDKVIEEAKTAPLFSRN